VSLAVNGQKVTPHIDKGYAVINRKWQAGDRIDLVLPMQVQRVTADPKIAADRGLEALRYGPLIYNVDGRSILPWPTRLAGGHWRRCGGPMSFTA